MSYISQLIIAYNTRVLAHIQKQFEQVIKHIYINPLEKCNLKCKICYTRKTSPILSPAQIEDFVDRYQAIHKLESITFCGGEVFALTYFPGLLNRLTEKGIFTQIITNGTIDVLDQIDQPNLTNVIVSLDGLEEYHDRNRGQGNFAKSVAFLKKAGELGFHREIFSIVTKQNLPQIDAFETFLTHELGPDINVTYHPRKPPTYLMHHPVSNIVGETDGFDFLNKVEMLKVMRERTVFPPKNLGCFQIAVMSDGKVYGCCEGITPLGQMTDGIESLSETLARRVEQWQNTTTLHHCLGCSQGDFVCGIKDYLAAL